jgi:hypothetical protein
LSLIKFFKTLHVSASIGHPQVLKLFFKRIAVILVIHAFSSLYLLCALFLVVRLRAYVMLIVLCLPMKWWRKHTRPVLRHCLGIFLEELIRNTNNVSWWGGRIMHYFPTCAKSCGSDVVIYELPPHGQHHCELGVISVHWSMHCDTNFSGWWQSATIRRYPRCHHTWETAVFCLRKDCCVEQNSKVVMNIERDCLIWVLSYYLPLGTEGNHDAQNT